MMGNERFNNDHKHFSNMIISVMNVFKLPILESSPAPSLSLCVCVRLCVCVYTHVLSVFITRESTFKEYRLFFEMWIHLCNLFWSHLPTILSFLFLLLSLAPLLFPCHSLLYFKLSPTFQSNQCCPPMHGCGTIDWGVSNLPATVSPKEDESLFLGHH